MGDGQKGGIGATVTNQDDSADSRQDDWEAAIRFPRPPCQVNLCDIGH